MRYVQQVVYTAALLTCRFNAFFLLCRFQLAPGREVALLQKNKQYLQVSFAGQHRITESESDLQRRQQVAFLTVQLQETEDHRH